MYCQIFFVHFNDIKNKYFSNELIISNLYNKIIEISSQFLNYYLHKQWK